MKSILCGLVAASLLLLGGCGTPPLKGGKASIPFPGHVMPGNKVSPPGEVKSMDIQQPENPAQGASQSREATNETSFVIPAGSTVKQTTQSVSGEKTNTTTMEFKVSEPTPFKQVSGEHNRQDIGAAQKDTSRELSARFAAMRPVQWVGIGLFVVAGVLAYFQWWTKAAICAACGLGMIIIAQIIPGHELAILFGGGAACLIGCLAVMYAYNKGMLDKYLPPELDRNASDPTKPATPPTTETK